MSYRTTHLSRWVCILIGALLFLGQTRQAMAQGQPGAIAGNVTDPSGAVLKGAQVSIESKNLNVVSDEQGLFFIKDLAPGSYTLTITYVGFAAFNKVVDVAAGQTINVDAKLQLPSENQTVLVTAARAGGEPEAINVERTADFRWSPTREK